MSENSQNDLVTDTLTFYKIECLKQEIEKLKKQLEVSLEIQSAEKKILIKEINDHTQTKEALKRMVEMHDMTVNSQSNGWEWQQETLKMARNILKD